MMPGRRESWAKIDVRKGLTCMGLRLPRLPFSSLWAILPASRHIERRRSACLAGIAFPFCSLGENSPLGLAAQAGSGGVMGFSPYKHIFYFR